MPRSSHSCDLPRPARGRSVRSLPEVAVVGVGSTDYGALYRSPDPDRSVYALGLDALRLALDDAGLHPGDLDGLLLARIRSYETFATMAGIRHPLAVNSYEGAGRMAGVVLQHAAAIIAAGLASTVACVYANNGRSAKATYGGDPASSRAALEPAVNHARWDAAYGLTSPGAYVAAMYQRYMKTYRVPDGALAPLALSNRANAQKNPEAVMRSPLTENEYREARYIAEPLRLYDYCLVNDGGVALILTTPERAKHLRRQPVHLVASAARADLTDSYVKDDLFERAATAVAARIRTTAGVSARDVDLLQVYDNFTPIVLWSLEHFGVARKGEGWRFVADQRTTLTGELPVNTSGGHTSEGYLQGWGLLAEAVRQLRHEAGERQVAHARTAMYICVSPIVTAHVFERAEDP